MVGGRKSKYFFSRQSHKKKAAAASTSASASANASQGGTKTEKTQKSISSFFKTKPQSQCDRKRRQHEDSDEEEIAEKGKKAKLSFPVENASLQRFKPGSTLDETSEPLLIPGDPPSTSNEERPSSSAPTPLEKQVIELKKRYPNVVLFVECGYRYRFFGEDASFAAKVLGISCHQDRLFMTASVPTFNGPGYYVRKLVDQGRKVGIVSQTETAAAKKTGSSSSSAPFSRALTAVYTRTTFLGDDIPISVAESMTGDPRENAKSVIAAIFEEDGNLALAAIQPTTGQISYASFKDDAARNELKRILAMVGPLDIIIPKTHLLQPVTKAAINFYCEVSNGHTTLETVHRKKFAPEHLLEELSKMISPLTQYLCRFDAGVKCCLAGLLSYLKEFKMELSLIKSDNVSKLDKNANAVFLPAYTIRNLELFQSLSLTGNWKIGTLYQRLNRTKTRPGSRLLKDWISAPLTNIPDIVARQDAVEYILKTSWGGLSTVLHKLMDIELALTSTLNYKIRPRDFLRMCEAMSRVYKTFSDIPEGDLKEMPGFLAERIQSVKTSFAGMEEAAIDLNEKAAKDEDFEHLFNTWDFAPQVGKKKGEISAFLEKFQGHKKTIGKALGIPNFEYSKVSGLEFLIEVKQARVKDVPKDWTKVNSTKQVARYRSKFVVDNLPHLTVLREQLVSLSKEAWQEYLKSFNDRFHQHCLGARCLAELDCLQSLATVSSDEGFVRPSFNTDSQKVDIKKGRNIVLESVLPIGKQYVPNDIQLGGDGKTAMVLSGPNMGGKSCYLRQFATIAILSQMGSFVPAEAATMPIFDAIFVRIGASDDLLAGKSTLMIELEEASLCLHRSTKRSLVLLDELGRGTSTSDGCAIAQAVLRHLVNDTKSTTVFVTHYRQLIESVETELSGRARNAHMGYAKEASEDPVLLLYELRPGKAEGSFGMNVALMAGVPEEVVEMAKDMAQSLEETVE